MRDLFDLSGRVALITGGNGGIGLAMAEALATFGAEVAIVGRDPTKMESAVQQLQAVGRAPLPLTLDLAEPKAPARAVAAVVERFGRLDILVANAGTNLRKPPQDYTDEEFAAVLELNLMSVHRLCVAAYPALKAAAAGRILVVGSIMSHLAAPFNAPYCASKGGVVQLARAYATAWAADGIRVNAILPGWIDTELTRRARRDIPGLHDKVVARTPVGRWGRPRDLAAATVFLAGPGADFITGAAIPVDGGYLIAA